VGQRNEIFDQRGTPLGPLAEPDRAHLGEAADRLGQPLADRFDPGDEGGRDRAHSDQQDAEFPFRFGD
jgi:hypothetical protein